MGTSRIRAKVLPGERGLHKKTDSSGQSDNGPINLPGPKGDDGQPGIQG